MKVQKEELFEEQVKAALYEQMEQQLQEDIHEESAYDRQEEHGDAHAFSKEFEDKMEQLVQSVEEEERRRKRGLRQKAAVAAVLALAVIGTVTMQVDAWRKPILNFIVGEKAAVVQTGKQYDEFDIPESYREVVPAYVPEGFWLDYVYGKKMCHLRYCTLEESYTVAIFKEEKHAMVDSEEGRIKDLPWEGGKAAAFEAEGKHWIIGVRESYTFFIEGDISLEEMERVLYSIG